MKKLHDELLDLRDALNFLALANADEKGGITGARRDAREWVDSAAQAVAAKPMAEGLIDES